MASAKNYWHDTEGFSFAVRRHNPETVEITKIVTDYIRVPEQLHVDNEMYDDVNWDTLSDPRWNVSVGWYDVPIKLRKEVKENIPASRIDISKVAYTLSMTEKLENTIVLNMDSDRNRYVL